MPLDSSRFILPPPVGVSNDLYEAYPQKADTVFDTFNSRFPDITSNRVTKAPNPFGELPDVSSYDYSYLNTQGSNAANSKDPPDICRGYTDRLPADKGQYP